MSDNALCYEGKHCALQRLRLAFGLLAFASLLRLVRLLKNSRRGQIVAKLPCTTTARFHFCLPCRQQLLLIFDVFSKVVLATSCPDVPKVYCELVDDAIVEEVAGRFDHIRKQSESTGVVCKARLLLSACFKS